MWCSRKVWMDENQARIEGKWPPSAVYPKETSLKITPLAYPMNDQTAQNIRGTGMRQKK